MHLKTVFRSVYSILISTEISSPISLTALLSAFVMILQWDRAFKQPSHQHRKNWSSRNCPSRVCV